MYLEGHDSKELFRNLSRQTKASLTKFHNNFVKGQPQFHEATKRGIKIDLDSLLESGRDAFTQFRYPYEDGVSDETTFGLGGLILGVKQRIFKHHPEWKQAPVGKPTSRAH